MCREAEAVAEAHLKLLRRARHCIREGIPAHGAARGKW